jgi:hypothetical protein
MERLQVEEMMGMVKEMVVLRRNRESNVESIINREQKEAYQIRTIIKNVYCIGWTQNITA